MGRGRRRLVSEPRPSRDGLAELSGPGAPRWGGAGAAVALALLSGCGEPEPLDLVEAAATVERVVSMREPRRVEAVCSEGADGGATCSMRDASGRRGLVIVARNPGTPDSGRVRVAPNRYVVGKEGEDPSLGFQWLWPVDADGMVAGEVEVEDAIDRSGMERLIEIQASLALKAAASDAEESISCEALPPVGRSARCYAEAPFGDFRIKRVDAAKLTFVLQLDLTG